MTTKQEQEQVELFYNLGVISKEERDKLLDDIAIVLWREL